MKAPGQNLRTPGPIPVPDDIVEAMGQPMISHRGPEFAALIRKVTEQLKLYGQILCGDQSGRLDASPTITLFYAVPGQGDRLAEDPTLLELVNQARAVTNPAKRNEAFNALFKRLRKETYELRIGNVNIPFAVGPRVAVWQPWPFAFYPSSLHGIVLK